MCDCKQRPPLAPPLRGPDPDCSILGPPADSSCCDDVRPWVPQCIQDAADLGASLGYGNSGVFKPGNGNPGPVPPQACRTGGLPGIINPENGLCIPLDSTARPNIAAEVGLSNVVQATGMTCKPAIPPFPGVHGGADRCCQGYTGPGGAYEVCKYKVKPAGAGGAVDPFA